MPNPECNSQSYVPAAAGAKAQIVLRSVPDAAGKTTNFTFPWSGPPPLSPADLAALQSHEDAAVAAAVKTILDAIASGSVSTGGTASPDPGGTPTPTPTVSGGSGGSTTPAPAPSATVLVGPGRDVREIADALGLVTAGGTIIVDDGVYQKSGHCPVAGVTIKSASGNPGKCYLDGQGGYGAGHRMAWGKGMLHFTDSFTVQGIGFRNCGSPASGDTYSNEAGIWIGDNGASTPWTATITRCAFDGNANGVFTSAEPGLTVTIKECVYGRITPNGLNAYANGSGSHPAHDNYLSAKCDVSGSYFYGSVGHNVKTRSDVTNVHDNPVMTQDGGRVVDCCEGGAITFANNTVFTRTDRADGAFGTAGGRFGNSGMLGYADENTNHGTAGGAFSGNTLHISRTNSVVWVNAGSMTASGNTVNCYGQGSLAVQGRCDGLSAQSAPPSAPATPPNAPAPPAWFAP